MGNIKIIYISIISSGVGRGRGIAAGERGEKSGGGRWVFGDGVIGYVA